MELFTLESMINGYEDYWELDWCGLSFKDAISEKNRIYDKYNAYYEIFRITVWIDGVKNQVFYYRNRDEIDEGEVYR